MNRSAVAAIYWDWFDGDGGGVMLHGAAKGVQNLFTRPTGEDGIVYDSLNAGTARDPLQGSALIHDGVDGVTIFGNVGTIEYVSMWVTQAVDNQILFSLANTAATNVSVVAGVLTFGASITAGTIYVDNVAVSAAAAGATLNDNADHHLLIKVTSIAASNFELAYDSVTYGNATFHDVRVGNSSISVANVEEAFWGRTTTDETGWWPLQERAGTFHADIAGSDLHGTSSGGVTHVRQDIKCFNTDLGYNLIRDFNGTTDKIVVPNAANLSFGDGATDSACSFTATVIMNDALLFKVFEKGDSSNHEYLFGCDSTGKLQLILVDSVLATARIGRGTAVLTPYEGQVLHIVGTYDGLGVEGGIAVDVYDSQGSLLVSDSVTASSGSYVAMEGNSLPQNIGHRELSSQFSDGDLLDVRVHNTELTAGEVTAWLADPSSLTGHEVSRWKLNDESTTVATDSIGSNDGAYTGTTKVYVPALSSSVTKDVLGQDLLYIGPAPLNGQAVNASHGIFNGVSDTIAYGNVGSVTSLSIWIRMVTDNDYILSLDNTTAKEVHVVAGVLTFGASLTDSNITVDGVSKTPTEAGALLNDNTWHLLAFDLVSVTATALTLGSSVANFGNFEAASLELNGGVLFDAPLAEGDGLVSFDVAGANHGTITATASAFWGFTNQSYFYNVANGFNIYDDTGDKIKVPEGIDANALYGWTLDSNNPSGVWWNNPESVTETNPFGTPSLIRHVDRDETSTLDYAGIVWNEFINNEDIARVQDYRAYTLELTTTEAEEVFDSMNKWDPSQMTLAMWLEAYYGKDTEGGDITIVTGISNWADRSQGADDVTQGTTSFQPPYNDTSVKSERKGTPDSVDNRLDAAAFFTAVSSDIAGEFWAVTEKVGANNAVPISFGDSAGTAKLQFYINQADGNIHLEYDANTVIFTNTNTGKQVIRIGTDGSNYFCWSNGDSLSIFSGTDNGNWIGDNVSLDNCKIGMLDGSSDTFYTFDDYSKGYKSGALMTTEEGRKLDHNLNMKYRCFIV